ncbi:tetraspanin-15 isoform X2 [Nerophis lumbriciformis]|uniref:tetraspanin-15 isoform X2 n=1 Tax=Nerophis lumbriciformis TaxID=546530 RepID=UPI002AE05157|nr:tetraspanin-15-like isoform X2 [Nerophis lumbriciformis]
MPPYSELKKSNHFYYFIKFTLNVYSMLFSLMGLCVLCVGVYAEVERQKNRTLEGLFLAPAVVLILLGLVMFTVSLVGMVGSLRDNKTLLHMFLCVLCVLLLLQAIALIIALLFEKKTSALFQSSIREGIKHYYDDLDFKNILDYVQEKFSCCGGDEYKDWAVNQYHFCNGTGPLACGVPYTCCIPGKVGEVINTLCGSKAMALDKQLLGIVLTCLFWNLLVEMSQSVDMVDFKLKKLEFKYNELDLAGAGCCMCLPRDGGYLPIPVAEPDLDPIDVHLQKLKKQPPRTHSQLLHLQQSRSTTGLDEVDVGRKLKREH